MKMLETARTTRIRVMSPPSLFALTLAAAMLPVSDADAALVELDWKSAGDKLITMDTATGLEWLDLTQTAKRSYNSVVDEFVAGGEFEGFRYASTGEVKALLGSAGWPAFDLVMFSSAAYEPLSLVQELLGVTWEVGFLRATIGRTGDLSFGARDGLAVYASPFLHAGVTVLSSGWNDAVGVPFVGSWLVRDSFAAPAPLAVPEPGSQAMALLGLSILSWLQLRRKRSAA